MPVPVLEARGITEICGTDSSVANVLRPALRYFAFAQSQPFAQVHVPVQAQCSAHVQRAGLAAQPHELA